MYISPLDYDYGRHNTPAPQYVLMLDGRFEIEVSDGSKCVLTRGDILLAEDTTGRGHIRRVIDGKACRSLFVTLAES